MTADNLPAKFRKKPVVIEAMQFNGHNHGLVASWAGTAALVFSDEGERGIGIQTLEGVMQANPGDWIVRGVKGEFYPVKPDIFEATYERV